MINENWSEQNSEIIFGDIFVKHFKLFLQKCFISIIKLVLTPNHMLLTNFKYSQLRGKVLLLI